MRYVALRGCTSKLEASANNCAQMLEKIAAQTLQYVGAQTIFTAGMWNAIFVQFVEDYKQ